MSKWSKEDLTQHSAVGAVIQDPKTGHVLIQKHNKLQMYTIPSGKFKKETKPADALRTELMEECGITPTEFEQIDHSIFHADRDGQKMAVPTHIFLVKKYDGEIKNNEPDKHEEQEFMDPNKLVMDGKPISYILQRWLRHQREKK